MPAPLRPFGANRQRHEGNGRRVGGRCGWRVTFGQDPSPKIKGWLCQATLPAIRADREPTLLPARQCVAPESFIAGIASRTVGHDAHLQDREQAKPCQEDKRSDKNGNGRTVTLIHSRFRPMEREDWMNWLKHAPPPEGRIIISTQV